jgi:hypothetical protein
MMHRIIIYIHISTGMQATSVSGKNDLMYAESETQLSLTHFYFHIKIIPMFVWLTFYFVTLHMPNVTWLLGTVAHRGHF